MKRFRLPYVVAGAVVLLLALAIGVAFSSSFQTWAVRRALAGQPGIDATIGSVSAGLKRIELRDVRFNSDGAVLIAPLIEAEMPLLAVLFDDHLDVSRLAANGWTLDLSKTSPARPAGAVTQLAAAGGESVPAAKPTPDPSSATAAAGEAFSGIFSQLRAPLDLSVDGVQLQGGVILPESRGTVKVTLAGGGLAVNRQATFEVAAEAALTDPGVKAVDVRGTIVAGMDTPRTFTRVGAKIDAAATGTKFPEGVKLHVDASAARVEAGETYSAAVFAGGQNVITVTAALPRNGQAFGGAWKLNVRDVDLAPFAFGKPLLAFTAVGEGKFDGDPRFETVHVAGRLNTNIDRLGILVPELAAIGELKISADFDVAGRDGSIAVEKLDATVSAAEPVATIRVLQPFEFNAARAELRTADMTRELLGVALQGLPVAWAAPFVSDLQLQGGRLRGDLSLVASGGGITLRTTTPLRVDGMSVSQSGKLLAQSLDLALNASADYTPTGWQAELNALKVSSGSANLLSLDAKIGQLTGGNQPIKATGTLRAELPAFMTQPGASGVVIVTGGEAVAKFVVSLNEKKEIQADVALTDLATVVEQNAVKLPSLSSKLRADISPDGKIAFNAPVEIERSGRKSDLTLIGTIGPERDRARAIDATVTSNQFIVEDAGILAAVVPDNSEASATDATSPPPATPASPAARDTVPPWAGLHGVLTLQLKRIVYSDAVEVNNVSGRLRIDAGIVKLESLQAGLGETGRADLKGALTFTHSAPQPYALTANIDLREFDPAPLFRATGNQATIEGKFDVTSKLDGRAATFAELGAGAAGTFQLTSKGGVFRGLPVDVGNIVENSSKLAAWLASAGTAISAMTGKKEYGEVANKAQAVAELAKGLNPIPYDQLSVSIARDAALNTTLRNFTLISPEIRLTGSGTALHKPGSCLLEDSLAMEFMLRARGRQSELLKYLGALEPQTDDLGYASCTVPLKIGGTLGKPDTSEVNSKLTALAVEKSGFGDKAAEFLNKIRGGK